jgi:hypothetical protein
LFSDRLSLAFYNIRLVTDEAQSQCVAVFMAATKGWWGAVGIFLYFGLAILAASQYNVWGESAVRFAIKFLAPSSIG